MHIIVVMLMKIVRIFRVILSLIFRFLFSFNYEKIIAKQGSKYNQSIIITKYGSRRIMRFNQLSSGAQSQIDLNKIDYPDVEYIRMMIVCLVYNPLPLNESNILIIGLGGGTLPRAIRKLSSECLITIIEIDPLVYEMAKKYFYFEEDSKMKVFITDGRQFLFNLSQLISYNIIYVDAYDSVNGLPNHMKTKEFFIELKNRLNTNGGLLIINLVCIYQSYLNVRQTIYSVFGIDNLIIFRSNELLNMIIVASPSLQQLNNKSNLINEIKQILSIDVYHLLNTKVKQSSDKDSTAFIYTDEMKNIQNEEHISFQQFIHHV